VDNGRTAAASDGKASAGSKVPDSGFGVKLSEAPVSKTTPASAYAAKIADSITNSSPGVKTNEEPKSSEKPSEKQANNSMPALADGIGNDAGSVAPAAKSVDSSTGGARAGITNLATPTSLSAVGANKNSSKDAKSAASAAKPADSSTGGPARVGIANLAASAPDVANKKADVPHRADPYVQDSARERNVYGKAAGKMPSEPATPEGVATLSPHHTPASPGYRPNRDAVNSPAEPGMRISPISPSTPTLSVGSSAYTESTATDEDHADRLSTVSELGPEGDKKKKTLRKRLKKGLSKAFVEPFRSHKEDKATWK
jgi:hypothetical protein